MAGQYISQHEIQSWKLMQENQEQTDDHYLKSAAEIARMPGAEGQKIRNEQDALDRLQTRRAEKIIGYPYKGICEEVLTAFHEHGLTPAEELAIIKQFLRVDFTKAIIVGEDGQIEICERALKARANHNIGELSYAELKSLLNACVFDLGKAGEHSQKYIGELLVERRETQSKFRDQIGKWVRDAERQDRMEGCKQTPQAGHDDVVEDNARKKSFHELELPRINRENAESPTSGVVIDYSSARQNRTQDSCVRASRNSSEDASSLASQDYGRPGGSLSLPNTTTRPLVSATVANIGKDSTEATTGGTFRYVSHETPPQQLPDIERVHLQALSPQDAPNAADLLLMQNTFRAVYKAHSANEGAGTNLLHSQIRDLSTEQLKRMLSCAEHYDTGSMFQQSKSGEQGRLAGLQLFGRYQDTLRATIAHRENLIPGTDYRLQPSLSAEALAHTFLQDQASFQRILTDANVDSAIIDNALEKAESWSKTASGDKAKALATFKQQLLKRRNELDDPRIIVS